jgi:hypothetical protein
MNKKVRQEILNLSQAIFDDAEYSTIVLLLNTERLNQLRVFVNEKLEFMEALFHLQKNDEVLRTQIELCDKLENIVIDAFLEIA